MLLPIIAIQIASIAVCYVAQYHAADEYFPDYMVGLMAVLLLINILIVFYVEALRENELENSKPSSMSSSTIFKWNTTSSSKNARKKSVLCGMM